jgi:cold shock protein
MSDTRKTGTIARLMRDRVFGFIHCPADECDYFFHQTHLIDGLTFAKIDEGDTVSFVVGQGPKGPEAQDVTVEKHDPVPGTQTRKQLGLPDKPKRIGRPRRG